MTARAGRKKRLLHFEEIANLSQGRVALASDRRESASVAWSFLSIPAIGKEM
jgi:hypothetical protein